MLYIFGDTHAEWGKFNTDINKIYQREKTPLDIIVAGDFGFWPREKEYDLGRIKTDNIRIWFCPGNHEDWFSLDEIEKENKDKSIIEIHKNIFYCTFGSTMVFGDKKFMFCGGAESIDKNLRTLGYDWFPQETISIGDMYKLPEKTDDIDVVISHTCPDFVFNSLKYRHKIKDPSCKMLTQIYEIYSPKRWFFGHFHTNFDYLTKKCKFTCLNHSRGHSKSYIKFES